MNESYELCSDVDRIARELIEKEKVEEFKDVDPNDIVGMKVIKEKSSFLAKIFKISPRLYPLLKSPKELGIVVWNAKWDDIKTDEATRYLIIYHELMHIKINAKTGEYKLRKHDVEDFKKILSKSGLNWESTSWIMDGIKSEKAVDNPK